MPHYADGKQAYVGDFILGKPYNTPHEIVGQIVSITSNSDACNCIVAFVIEDNDIFCESKPTYALPPAVIINDYNSETATYTKKAYRVSTDYGAIKEYKLLKSANQEIVVAA